MPLVHFSRWYQIIFRYSLLHLPKRKTKVVFLKEHVFFLIHTRPFFKVLIFFLQELWMPGTFASFISFVASQIWGRPRKYSTASEPANSSSFSYRAVHRTHVYRAVHRTHAYRAVHRTLIAPLFMNMKRSETQSEFSWKMNVETGSPSYLTIGTIHRGVWNYLNNVSFFKQNIVFL